MFAATSWTAVASFLIFIALARLLDPLAFGVYALAQVVLQVVVTLITSGLSDVIIQKKDLTEQQATSIFWANLFFSLCAASVLWSFADLYAAILNVPEVASALRWLAPTLPFEALAAIHMARKLKAFGHKVVALRSIASSLVGGGVAISAAFMGGGILSLVLQAWTTSLLNAIFAWTSFHWAPALRFSWTDIRPILPLSGSVVVTRILWVLLGRAPDLFIGRALGPAAAGEYRVAMRLLEMILQTVLYPFANVAFSTLSHLQHDRGRFEAAYLRLLGAGALVTFPLLLGAAVVARDAIPLLFGEKWATSADIFSILALIAIPTVLNYLVGQTLTAVGKARDLVLMAIVQVSATVVVSFVVTPFGLVPFCFSYVLRAYALVPYQQYVLYTSSGISTWKCIQSISPPLFSATLMVGVLLEFNNGIRAWVPSAAVYVTTVMVLGAGVYVGALFLLWPSFMARYRRVLATSAKLE
jgi:O-antigen/teichoic acid export membrane protein